MRKLVLDHADVLRGLIQTSSRCSAAQRLDHKLHCLLLVAEGRSCYEVARWFGEHPRTLERWVLAFGRAGSEGLMPHLGRGRPSRLDATVMADLLLDLSASPVALGYSSRDWNSKLLMQHLRSRYRVGLGKRQCQP